MFLLADNSQVNLTCVKCVLEIPVLYPLVVDALADHMTKFLFDQSNRNIDALVINDPTDVIVKRFLLECEKLILMFLMGLISNRFLFFLPFSFPTCCIPSKIYGADKFSYLDF